MMSRIKKLKNRINYLIWAARSWSTAQPICPFCAVDNASIIKRKYIVTALYRCNNCGLLFRVPKDDPREVVNFYQNSYSEGYTTDCPSDSQLEILKAAHFHKLEGDYRGYIQVLQATGVQSGQSILDFGCSWGYGSWQMSEAGYEVYSYEISKPRARYAAEKMECRIVDNLGGLPEKVDCFFSAHVIEHLPVPSRFWEAALQVLKPNGIIVAFTPNGELRRAELNMQYHQMWGQSHPILLTARALQFMARQYGFVGNGYTSPYDLTAIENRQPGTLDGDELVFVAQHNI